MDSPAMAALADLPHLLVVDDDTRLRALLARYLGTQVPAVPKAASAAEARACMRSLAFDLLVLDIMMPGQNGLDFAKALRAEGCAMPILMLTARSEAEERIQGLEAGADDYLPKPFEPRELLLRIHAILRRVAAKPVAQNEVIRFGRWTLDRERGELVDEADSISGRLPLTPVEHNLLKALAGKKGEVV